MGGGVGIWWHTSARNALSSSASFTCETSKNLNCHFHGISFASMRAQQCLLSPESRPFCYRSIVRLLMWRELPVVVTLG